MEEGDATLRGDLDEGNVSTDAVRLGGVEGPFEIEAEDLFVHEVTPDHPFRCPLARTVMHLDFGTRSAVLAGGSSV